MVQSNTDPYSYPYPIDPTTPIPAHSIPSMHRYNAIEREQKRAEYNRFFASKEPPNRLAKKDQQKSKHDSNQNPLGARHTYRSPETPEENLCLGLYQCYTAVPERFKRLFDDMAPRHGEFKGAHSSNKRSRS